MADADPSIQKRTYFYIDEGNGTQPETSVGSHAHRVVLRNLYEPQSDGFAIWRKGHDFNSSELAVHKAGYDGYYLRGRLEKAKGGKFGVAVLLGQHNIPVKYVGRYGQGAI
jgi:hypothetical protein